MKVTIMLACAAGMSTSLMVERMKNAAENKVIEAEIFAVPVGEVDNYLEDKKIDIVLLGPQVRFMKSKFEEKAKQYNFALDIIPMVDYGMMNGEKVLDQAINLLNQ
ncbi:PTS sugar transporter subunit IIB [Clostridium perfringens]|uniref:PTS sugar transporter subunit IIB n=2 Tax=Clostridium perfringens TaxID=1502 RepID=UPI000991D1DA|nr:PTS sugar transporter subunit IIB [Clostridium perfringens]AQW22396.1 PTS sugar transporter subunit IIB [Clostridium perfringens]AQW25267.1 PTS sugar transporter subunit IIB [Clostridium perfringens]ATD50128.1 PTS sugar transporter subunit IIB [Clostridium perfringens]MBO3405557.1 PTS sugar transporter subunit IIB [Clostridium perfringens]MBO3411980.1 PTS sugar transporter subunit IIB [Clostridium perfringens]